MLVIYNWILWLLCYGRSRKGVTYQLYPQSHTLNSREFKNIVIIIFMYSLFTFFGGDIHGDMEMVEGGFRDAATATFFDYERIYVIFAQFSFGQLAIWKTFVYGLSLLFTVLTLKRIGKENSLYFLFYTLLFLPSMGSTRGVLAYSVYLYAASLIFVGTSKRKLGVSLIVASYFLHTSMIVPILLFFLSKIKLNRTLTLCLCASIPVVSGLINGVFMPYLENNEMFMASQMGFKYQQYIHNEDVTFQSSFTLRVYNIMTYIYVVLCLTISVIASWKIKISEYANRILTVCFYLAYISAIIALCDFPNSEVISRRYLSITLFFLSVIIPEVVNCNYLSWRKLKGLIAFGYFRINWFFAMMLWNEIS